MSLLLLLGGPAAPYSPDIPAITSPGDVAIDLYNPDWTMATPILQFGSFELEEREDGTEVLRVRAIPLGDLPAALYATGFNGCPIVCSIRRQERFVGIVTSVDDEDRETGGDVDVHLEAIPDWQYHTMGREVKGTGGARFTQTAITPNAAMALLINANCKTGDVIEPAAYAGLGTSGVERDNFGPHNVQGASSGTHPDTITRIRWPHGDSLFHSLMEGCRRYDCRIVGSWNKLASPKPLLTVTAVYPRLGTDRTGEIKFSRESETLRAFSRKVEHLAGGNVAEIQGKGARANQHKGYAIHQASYDAKGLREVGDLHHDGWQDDVDEEAEFIIAQVGGGETTYTALLREMPGMVFGVDCDLGDKITIDCSIRNVTVQDYITSIKWTMTGAGPLSIEVGLGREEISETARGGRSGGGRSGAGKKGGKPRAKNGEPEAVRKVITEDGDLVFIQVDDEWALAGESSEQRVRVFHHLVATPTDEDDGGETALWVYGDYIGTCPPCNGYVWIWAPNLGRSVKLLASDDGVGAGGGSVPGG